MLREIKTSNIKDDGMTKRWFNDDSMDLIIWHDENGRLAKFQLCYDKNRDEHALTWSRSKGLIHNAIDDGETYPGGHKKSPILAPDGKIDVSSIVSKLESRAEAVEQEVIEFISEKLHSLVNQDYGT